MLDFKADHELGKKGELGEEMNILVTVVHFQGKPFNNTVIQVNAPTRNAKEAEVKRFYEDLQDLLELTY